VARSFNGTITQYLQAAATSSSHEPGAGSFTAAIWATLGDQSVSNCFISKGCGVSTRNGWSIFYGTTGFLMRVNASDDSVQCASQSLTISGSLLANWFHLAIVVDRTANVVLPD
jgi:hypothetical protein